MNKTKLKRVLFISLFSLSVLSAITLCHIDNRLTKDANTIELMPSEEDMGYTKAKLVHVLYNNIVKAFRPSL